MVKDALIHGFRLNVDYTLALVEDVEDGDMLARPGGFANHPAFTLGHLVTATALTVKVLGQGYEVPEGWDELFRRRGPGDPTLPVEEPDRYPAKAQLVAVLKLKADRVVRLIEAAEPAILEERFDWKLDRYMPTVGEVLHFQCLIHHSWHIGQLAEWRRLMGYDSALKRLMEAG
jgi:hypothetical protein